MKFYSKALITAAVLSLNAFTAQADQICNSDGSGCMYTSWDCGSFTPAEGTYCQSNIAAPAERLEAVKKAGDENTVSTTALAPKSVDYGSPKPKELSVK